MGGGEVVSDAQVDEGVPQELQALVAGAGAVRPAAVCARLPGQACIPPPIPHHLLQCPVLSMQQ